MGPKAYLLLFALSAATVLAQQQQGGANVFTNPANLQYLFDRPYENMFFPKGRNGEVRFNLPPNYVDQRYRSRAGSLADRFGGDVPGGRVVNVPAVETRATRLCADPKSPSRQLGRNDQFSTFIKYHRVMARALIEALLEIPSYQDFASSAFFCRDYINPYMFSYATSVVILHRNDTRGVQLPLFSACFPGKFFDRALFSAARQEVNLVDSRNRDQRYRSRAGSLADRFGGDVPGGRVVNVPAVETRATRLCADPKSPSRQLGRNDQFSTFIKYHRVMARALIEALLEIPSYQDFASSAFFCRDYINPYMFSYATSVVILHRNDTRGVQLPLFSACFPGKFFDRALFSAARQEVNLVDSRNRAPIEIPLDWTGTNMDPEHRVAYFREDMGINLGHWNWHLVYPFEGPDRIVRKDRRGEIFYYFHQQIIARYNFERFCNNLGRVERFTNFREPMQDGYYPKLDSLVASRTWSPRPAGAILRDVKRPDLLLNFDIADLERWRDRIYEAIHRRSVQDTRGTQRNLDARGGIDMLGNIVESSILSVNPNLYGDMHNQGHNAIGLCHDPDHRHLENYNIMGDPGTTMRDPVFYRWHGFVDDLFHEHKRTLPPYTEAELGFNGVRVTGARVETQGLNRANEFSTFWQQDDIDFSRGLDFQPRGPVFARITHLQHTPFVFRIQVQNTGAARQGTVRIFLAPRFDERMTPLRFEDQRLFFIELDKFQINMRQGNNSFVRRSNESSVTVPFERTFRDLSQEPEQPGVAQSYCACGWPQHMLIPKGTQAGFDADLFVMVSNFADDRVNQTAAPNVCRAGHSYCGVLNQRYPDNRPMGYPFDRRARQTAQTLATFLTPNMIVTPTKIRFLDITRPPAGAGTGLVNRIDLGNPEARPPNNANRPAAPNNANAARAPNNANAARPPNNANAARARNNANPAVPPGAARRVRAPVHAAPAWWD